jgi:hypothetical protein
MKVSPAAQRLLRSFERSAQARWKRDNSRLQRLTTLADRRARVAERFRRTLLLKAYRSAGINAAQIAARQAVDNQLLQRIQASEKRLLDKDARTIRKDQRERLEGIARSRVEQERWIRPDVVIAHLDTATTAFLGASPINAPGTVTTAAGDNALDTKLSLNNSGVQVAQCTFQFLWQPPRLGNLNVLTFLQANGSFFYYVGASCSESGSAGAHLDAIVSISQADGKGGTVTESGENAVIFDRDTGDRRECLGDVGGNAIDSITPLTCATNFIANPDVPLAVSVTLGMWLRVTNGASELDFSSGARKLNIPFVHLTLT